MTLRGRRHLTRAFSSCLLDRHLTSFTAVEEYKSFFFFKPAGLVENGNQGVGGVIFVSGRLAASFNAAVTAAGWETSRSQLNDWAGMAALLQLVLFVCLPGSVFITPSPFFPTGMVFFVKSSVCHGKQTSVLTSVCKSDGATGLCSCTVRKACLCLCVKQHCVY